MRGFATDVSVVSIALEEVLAVESELVLSDNDLVAILLDVGKDDLRSLEDVDDFPLVNKHAIDRVLIGANEHVLSSWVGNFFLLSDAEVDKFLRGLLKFLLDEDGAALNNVSVLTNHVQGQFELSSRRLEVLVSDLEVGVQSEWSVLKWA